MIAVSIKGRMQNYRTFLRANYEKETFFRNLAISICSNIVVTDNSKKNS